ncbi:hypothetical protein [Jannaschia pohangensis]|uniref:Uncharacterized protein n=1 Tax=Jannaschia pohangensis TaxID=390807 RepID=A0A1I3SEL2_9RHOB|nr:hypothetical protein [Jannaschia pohangensis]SFJ56079.1 hypothetical protein SAMN04488095_3090 [Jannaschia pohangensis]
MTRAPGRVFLRAGLAWLACIAFGITNIHIIYVAQSVLAGLILGAVSGLLLLGTYVTLNALSLRWPLSRRVVLGAGFSAWGLAAAWGAAIVQAAPGSPTGFVDSWLVVDAAFTLPILLILMWRDGWFGELSPTA